MVMNVIGKFSYIGLQENPREKKKKRQSFSPQTKAPGPGHKKTAGENFALWLHIWADLPSQRGYSSLCNCLKKKEKPVHSLKAKIK